MKPLATHAGSRVSEKAFEVALHFWRNNNHGPFHIYHVWSRDKTNLPIHLTPKHIKNEYDILLIKHKIDEGGAGVCLLIHALSSIQSKVGHQQSRRMNAMCT